MDPITLFALANGAVSAVKAGCKLYKDIKGAAGEVKDVLKDLDEQFKKLHPPEKPATIEQRNQFIREKNEVIELNKKANSGAHTNIYAEIGEHLGTYYDNFYKCQAIFEEEEKRSKNEVYTGEASLGKRALQRVLMRKQLEQMSTELRELMVYQSPPELGALYTEVSEMMETMGKEQKIVIAKKMKEDAIAAKKAAVLYKKRKHKAMVVVAVIFVILFYLGIIGLVIHNRHIEHPELGQGILPERVANYDEIIAKRNREYWADREKDVRQRTNENLWKKKE